MTIIHQNRDKTTIIEGNSKKVTQKIPAEICSYPFTADLLLSPTNDTIEGHWVAKVQKENQEECEYHRAQ